MTDDLIKLDGFDDAIVGKAMQGYKDFYVYDKKKILLILQRDMLEDEAVMFFNEHVARVFGDSTPVIMTEYKNQSKIERLNDDI